MKQRLLFSFLALTCMTGFVHGQTLRAYKAAAERAFAEKDYYSAYMYLETIIQTDSSRMDVQYNLAEAARLFHAYSNAEILYRNVLNSADRRDYPEAQYWLASVQQIQGHYAEAIENYEQFAAGYQGANRELVDRAHREIANCHWAMENIHNIDDSVTVERLGEAYNTLYSEFGAIQVDDEFYFSRLATERMSRDRRGRPMPPALLYSQVWRASEDEAPQLLDTTFNDPYLHTSNTTFNIERSRVYYSLCEYLNRYDDRCDIYYRDIVDGVFGEVHKLPEPINLDGYTTTQPNVAYDEALEREILYFSSDRPGGHGGMDIWYSVINDPNNLTQPRPLMAVNTPGDEVTPFFHHESQTLYFSSDGHKTFGGFDVQKIVKVGDQWGPVENVGPDINSSFHDVYYTLSADEKTAHYSSNRIGSLFLDAARDACCYDIYEASARPVEVNVIVETYNKRTLAPLYNVTLTLIAENGIRTEETVHTGPTHITSVPISRNKRYTIIGNKEGFEPDSVTFSTYHITESVDINQKLYLDPNDVIVEVRTFDARQRQPLPNTTVEIINADGISQGVKTNERSHITHFGIPPGIGYTVTGTRKGYRQATAQISEADFDMDTIVVELYLELGNLEDFLPLAIYFDNDEPDPRTWRGTTRMRYLETYTPYYAKKDRFKRRYVRGASDAAAAEAAIEDLFENHVRKSKEEFESFLHILSQYLEEGLSFVIYLKGFTSPLASDAYNYQLGQRRIQTIQNEFAAFRGGIIASYFDNKQLEVLEKSFGKDLAPAHVSDSPTDLRRSVYSPEASLERRVEIIEIEKDH